MAEHPHDVVFKEIALQDIFCLASELSSGFPYGCSVPDYMLRKGNTARISARNTNNGVAGYYQDINSSKYITFENCITVSFLGTVFYHPYKVSLDTRVFCLKPKGHELNTEEGLYLVTCIRKVIHSVDFYNALTNDSLKNTKIVLPVNEETDEIAWCYMKDFVSDMLELCNNQIQIFLGQSGLDDCRLSDTDVIMLTRSGLCDETNTPFIPFLKTKTYKKFKVKDLFDVVPSQYYNDAKKPVILKDKEKKTPIISSTLNNNSVKEYCNYEPLEAGGVITFSDTTIGPGSMRYQAEPFIGYQHVQVMKPYAKDCWKEEQLLFFIGAMQKAGGTGWNYANKFQRKLVLEMELMLPIMENVRGIPMIDKLHKFHPDGYIPDWAFMAQYIKTIEKITMVEVAQQVNNV